MLRNLHVKNLALMNEAEVDFSSGLNILTGETGAGKSIIIGSINLALGEKIKTEMLRDNEDPAMVELVFEVTDPKVEQQLKDLDVYLEDGCVIINRKIVAGRSVARINGETVPVSRIKDVASLLIDIYGQNEHQSLLKKKAHLDILDGYGKQTLHTLKEQVRDFYHQYQGILKSLDEVSMDEMTRQHELSLLEYEVEELQNANLIPGEDEELEQKFKKMAHGRKIMDALSKTRELTAASITGASDQVGKALHELAGVTEYDDALVSLHEQINDIDSLLNDFNRELADYVDHAEFDDESFARVEKRLNQINHLKTKYGASIEQIIEALKERQCRIEQLTDMDAYRQRLQTELAEVKVKLETSSQELSEKRQMLAQDLTVRVKDALIDLNFLDVSFDMTFERLEDYSVNGIDDAEFVISTNPGEPMKPLGKVASGGELSRIMLALKTVSAENDQIGTLIFDEIDTGISGRTAQAVAEKMNIIGQSHQVICITHLPQIAAMADSHFLIHKDVVDNSTASSIALLDEGQSVQELARMLGGAQITEIVTESAKEMKAMAQNIKQK